MKGLGPEACVINYGPSQPVALYYVHHLIYKLIRLFFAATSSVGVFHTLCWVTEPIWNMQDDRIV